MLYLQIDFPFLSVQLRPCARDLPERLQVGSTARINHKARVSEPELAFLAGTGAGAEKITKFRLRLLVNCKSENYDFVTTKKNIFFPHTNYRIYMFDFIIFYHGRKYFFFSFYEFIVFCLTIHQEPEPEPPKIGRLRNSA